MKIVSTNYNCDNDSELVSRLSKDDAAAYEIIFQTHWPSCFRRACAVVRDKESAQEIVQEVFMQLWNKRKTLLIQNLPFYLQGAVKNASLNYLRKENNYKKHLSFYMAEINKSLNTNEESVFYNDLRKNFENATSLLSPKAKKIMELSRLHGFTVPEIAKELNISVKAAEYHIHRSLNLIKNRLKEFGLLIVFFPFF